MAIEIPSYRVVKQDGKFEIRDYDKYCIASVHVNAETFSKAGNYGFGPLADYIFGNNTKTGKIKMTAPVDTQLSEQIPMTAPVDTSKSGENFKVSFTMPATYKLDTLPKPNNPDVQLEEVARHKTATLVFSGYTTESKIDSKIKELRKWSKEQGLELSGSPILSRYDSPWKPGFIRHNEVSFIII